MTIAVGEVGKVFRYATGFTMDNSTGLTLNFTKPSGGTLQKTEATSGAVTAPAVALTDDPDIGTVAASTYMAFTSVAADFDEAGKWSVCGTYYDTVAGQVFHGASATFTVLEACA